MEKSKSSIISFTVPPDIKEILDTAPVIGYYDSLSEFLRDAIRSHLKANKGIAALMAFHLCKTKRISIGKAAAIMGVSLEETKDLFKALET